MLIALVLVGCSAPATSTDAGRDTGRDVVQHDALLEVSIDPPDTLDEPTQDVQSVDTNEATVDVIDDTVIDNTPVDVCTGMVCNNQCVDTSNDPLNCGSCGSSCIGTSSMDHEECQNSTCTTVCNTGFANCTGDERCETDISDRTVFRGSVLNCGACGRHCPISGDESYCVNGLCACDPSAPCPSWGTCVNFRCIPN